MIKQFSETDLYLPVKKFFTGLGYVVNGEVKGCDVTASKENELIIIELKKVFNLKLLYQAMERMKITSNVFICIPRPKKTGIKSYKSMLVIIKKLEIGLITVALDSPAQFVEIVSYPENKGIKKGSRSNLLLKEIAGRANDSNKGGSRGVKLNTAFRERSIKIACILERIGRASAKELVNIYGCEKDAHAILYQNHYGWFQNESRGVYTLTQIGIDFLDDPLFAHVVAFYRQSYREMKGLKENEV